jgi:hypothetical protein
VPKAKSAKAKPVKARPAPVPTNDDQMLVEWVALDSLRPHPRNYQQHPDDQIEHLAQSLREHGFYRNVVIARDSTILAGHGVVQAAKSIGLDEAPCVRMDLDAAEPRALKLLAADNEISHLAERDDRALSELLKEVKDTDLDGLLGTGYDEMMLANLVMVSRPRSEIQDIDHAAHWVGMPEYEEGRQVLQAQVSFRNPDDRAEFCRLIGAPPPNSSRVVSAWYPPKEREDLASVRFEG